MSRSVSRLIVSGVCIAALAGVCQAQVLFYELGYLPNENSCKAIGIAPHRNPIRVVGGSDGNSSYTQPVATYWEWNVTAPITSTMGTVNPTALGTLTNDEHSEGVAILDDGAITGWSSDHNDNTEGFYIYDIDTSQTMYGTGLTVHINDQDECWDQSRTTALAWINNILCISGDAHYGAFPAQGVHWNDSDLKWFLYPAVNLHITHCNKGIVLNDLFFVSGMHGTGTRGLYWAGTALRELSTPPDSTSSSAIDISGDAKTAVGEIDGNMTIWDDIDISHGTPPAVVQWGTANVLNCQGVPQAVNENGYVVVGQTADYAAVWFIDDIALASPTNLKTFTNGRGINIDSWDLDFALDVSYDGRHIVGYGDHTFFDGTNEDTDMKGWCIILPEQWMVTDTPRYWSNEDNWFAAVPENNDEVIINNGGTVTVNADGAAMDVWLGEESGESGDLDLTCGVLTIEKDLYVGDGGTGTVDQSGGGMLVKNTLYIGNQTNASGDYDLAGGVLTVQKNLIVGDGGAGVLDIDSGSTISVANSVTLGANATLEVDTGCELLMALADDNNSAFFTIKGTNAATLAGLGNLTLACEFDSADVAAANTISIEAAGADTPSSIADFSTANFVIDQLMVGCPDSDVGATACGITVTLVDAYDNGNRGAGNEAVLVNTLSILAGGTIDNSNVDVYYLNGGAVKKFKPADANLDGAVNIDDFVIMKNNFGTTGATWAQGDFNGDRIVNIDDDVILKNHFGL